MNTLKNATTPTTAVTCGKNHDGNKHLTFCAREMYECDGCGSSYTQAEVMDAEKNTPACTPAHVGLRH